MRSCVTSATPRTRSGICENEPSCDSYGDLPPAVTALTSATETATSGRVAGKIALVTGGTRGIGRGIVEAFAREGAVTVFTGRDRDAGAAVARAGGRRAEYVACDATDLPRLRGVIADVVRRHGRLDVLVNNAGRAIGASLLESTEEIYDEQFDLNVRAAFFAMKWAAEAMVAASGGTIINITSAAATRGFRNRSVYSGTKAAVLQMSRAAALDVAQHNVRINCTLRALSTPTSCVRSTSTG